jgi:uracil-DNA glycosylase
MMINITLEESWLSLLSHELSAPYMRDLMNYLESEKLAGKTIFPPDQYIFEAFRLTPFENVKVVILGQDPYHGQGQAHGLAFSVRPGVKPPPSLVNIFKELQEDLEVPNPEGGSLEKWAKQGVLLLNAVLTVEEGRPGSHHQKGWERFTDKVIEILSEKKNNLVFILWGSPAQRKASKVDDKKHLILKSVHPSPLSVYRGFYGSKPFSKTNQYLRQHHIREIDWRLT